MVHNDTNSNDNDSNGKNNNTNNDNNRTSGLEITEKVHTNDNNM